MTRELSARLDRDFRALEVHRRPGYDQVHDQVQVQGNRSIPTLQGPTDDLKLWGFRWSTQTTDLWNLCHLLSIHYIIWINSGLSFRGHPAPSTSIVEFFRAQVLLAYLFPVLSVTFFRATQVHE